VCFEEIARVEWAQLRIQVEKSAELTKTIPLQTGMNADEHRKAFGGGTMALLVALYLSAKNRCFGNFAVIEQLRR
jgi:hypothetical protein